jgi:hypothetical protein
MSAWIPAVHAGMTQSRGSASWGKGFGLVQLLQSGTDFDSHNGKCILESVHLNRRYREDRHR